jgi:radical SAM superfamily enzyme YgiQ (UPF0313 family)
MRIAIVNPVWIHGPGMTAIRSGSRWPHVRRNFFNIYPFPFQLAYASSLLKREGHEVYAKDCIATNTLNEQLLSELTAFKPDIVFFETTNPTFKYDVEFIAKVRENISCRIFAGGQLATSFPEKILAFTDGAIAGECEYVLKAICDRIDKNFPLDGIPGLSIILNNKLITTPPELIANIDDLPWPDRNIGPARVYQDNFCAHFPSAQMITSRGCPHRCSFCMESYVFNHKANFRRRKISDVVDEMEMLKRTYGVKEIYFDDTSFTVDRPRVHELCGEIINRKLKIKWSCMADTKVDFDTLKVMKASGCRAIKVGVETVNPETLQAILKPVETEHADTCVDNCKKLGIFIHGTFILGLPGETETTLDQTIKFAFTKGFDWMQFSPAIPYSGTPFYEEAKKKGWLVKEEWDDECLKTNVNLSYPQLPKTVIEKKLVEVRQRLSKRILLRPQLAFKYIKLLIHLRDISLIKVVIRRILSVFGL